MANISNYLRHANQNYNEIYFIPVKILSPKSIQTINAGEGLEKREPSHTVGGNVNWYSHYRKQYAVSFIK